MSVLVVISSLAPLLADDAEETSAPASGGSGAAGAAQSAFTDLAWGSLVLSALVIGMALIFMSVYHGKLIQIVEKWVGLGGTISSLNDNVRDSAVVAGQARGSGLAITSDAEDGKIKPGQDVTFEATGLGEAELAKVTWSTAEGFPRTGAGPSWTSRAPISGTFQVVAAADGGSATVTLTVQAPAAQKQGGPTVALPFAIRGWGGLVITILGLGIVAALMFARIVSAEGGLGILGALLGVGAGSALASGTSGKATTPNTGDDAEENEKSA